MSAASGPDGLEIKGSFGARTVISSSAILVRSWRGEERTIGRPALAGYRTGVGRGVVYFYLIALDPQQKRVAIAVAANRKNRVIEALAPLPDLDFADLNAATEAIKQSDLWGLRPEDRLANLQHEKRVALAVNVVGGLVAAWTLLYPHPRMYAIIACVGVVGAVLVATLLKQGRWRVDFNKNDPRPSVAIAVLACSAGLCARALFDVHMFDWLTWLEWAAGVALVAALALPALYPELASNGAKVAVGCCALALALGCIGAADTLFDRGALQIYKAELLEKYVTHGKSTSYTWVLGPWGPSAGGAESVDSDLYDQLDTGGQACIYFHPGALGVRWYTLGLCGGGKFFQP